MFATGGHELGKLANNSPTTPAAQKAWQTGKLNFFSDATHIVLCVYGNK
jgi:hypothetical protein